MKRILSFSSKFVVVLMMAAIPALASTANVVNDESIAQSIRKNILIHSNYDVFDWIEAQVKEGTVRLSGSVREPWRKSEVEKIVMKVTGVAKVENEIQVLPLSTYDDQIRLRAARTIYGSSNLGHYALGANPSIHIIVENGRIVLKGLVANTMDRQLAETIVRNSTLAFDVKNELQVE